MKNEDVDVFTGEVMPEKKIQPQNENMMQIRSKYVAAMHVPVPRNTEKIIVEMERVARWVGHDFFYLWPVCSKDSEKVEMISGGTIELAETLLYYWTNIAIEHELKDLGDKWEIKHTFIDFEKGMSRPRTTIVSKPGKPPGGWDKERWERMKLNTAFSYNLRDLVLTVIPRWMKNKIINVAKKAELEKAASELKKGDAVNFFIQIKKDYGISEKELLSFFDETELNSDVYFKCKNIYAQLSRGAIKASSIKPEWNFEKSRKPKPKETPLKNKKPDPKSDMGKAPAKEAAEVATKLTIKQQFEQIMKSFDIRNISQSEITAYFGVDVSEMESEAGIADLKPIIENIEASTMTPEEFKDEANKRFLAKQKGA